MGGWRFPHLTAPRILVVRNDGLGDFLLTLPLIAALKRRVASATVMALVAEPLAGLAPLLPDLDGIIADPGVLLKRHRGRFQGAERRRRLSELTAQVRGEAFDMAVLPYAEGASAALVHRAGIKVRVGSLRRPFFWRFTHINTASRKRSPAAEYELNLDYLRVLGLPPDYEAPRVALPAQAAPSEPYAVLHPYKRSGTALSWPMAEFQRLAARLREAGLGLRVIGDEADEPVLRRAFGGEAGAELCIGWPLPRLAALLAGARCFVGNSSGPLHLAALVGTPHVGFFPQNQVSAPARWRTLPVAGAPADPADYLLSSDFPKGCVVCEKDRCGFFNCVATIPQMLAERGLERWGVVLPVAPTGRAARPSGA